MEFLLLIIVVAAGMAGLIALDNSAGEGQSASSRSSHTNVAINRVGRR